MRRKHTAGVTTLTVAAIAVGVLWWSQHATESSVGPATSAAPSTVTAAPSVAGADLLAQLGSPAPEDTGVHYDRDGDWGEWKSQGHSCNTRDLVLQQQGTNVRTVADCKIVAGVWTSPYDGVKTTNPQDLQIDHVVPVHQAALSGTRDWSKKQREDFYNDPMNLVAVTSESNQGGCHNTSHGRVCGKGDGDPGVWKPLNRSYWCTYATTYAQVKIKYRLRVDVAERDGLAQMLATCPGAR